MERLRKIGIEMTKEEKLAHVLSEFKRIQFPDSETHSDEYWMEVEVRCDNATDHICDMDVWVGMMIKYIEEE